MCCKDCKGVPCPVPTCPAWQQYIPEGECCTACRKCHSGEAPHASNIDCARSNTQCPAGGYACERNLIYKMNGDWTTLGLCCHQDCRGVLCSRLDCPPERRLQPDGACCPFCTKPTCADGSTPLSGNCAIEACPVGASCDMLTVTPVPGGPSFTYGQCCPLSIKPPKFPIGPKLPFLVC
jgi:hypothetical protein